MRIIFLDIDGVLNYASQGEGSILKGEETFASYFSPTYINTKNLLSIYQAYPNTRIVISSTWGDHLIHFGIWECLLYNAVHHEAVMRVHFDTVTPKKFSQSRENEILTWLRKHPEVNHFVILDDISMSLTEGHAVLVNPTIGLTSKDADTAVKLLNKPIDNKLRLCYT